MATAEETLSFELHQVENAIIRVAELKTKCKEGSAAFDFYTTIEEVFFGLNAAILEAAAWHRQYRNMGDRLAIMESILANHFIEKGKDDETGSR